ncbi:MAG: low molecular weight phosphotyrosine protein phosphatase [Flavobacteriaceae bacterium]|nr:low molecular weight phosphotyrosine protein phosphatase [Flavobacteriaceae bacterium]
MSIKILMVCLGNICRSPIAEGIMSSKLPKNLFFIDSCGTGDWHIGSQPDIRSITVCKKNGIDISNQKCRQFTPSDFDTFDYIYAMDKNNYNDIVALSKNKIQKNKVVLILNELYPNENKDIPDPYFGMENGFDNVFEMLDSTCEIIASKLISQHS